MPKQKGIPENVKNHAAKAIPEILSNELCSDKTKEKYIDMAKKGVKSGDQIYNNLTFIKTLLINSHTKFGEIRKINTKYNIIGIVLSAAESYLGKIAKLFKDPYDFNNTKLIEKHLSEKDPLLMGNHTHKEHIEKMFEIIQYLIEKSDGGQPFENNDIEKMFSVFVSKRISNLESEMLFDLVSGVEKNSRGYNSEEYLVSDRKVRKFIFQTCLCKKDYVTPHDYSPKSIRCFKDLFCIINDREGKIILDTNSVIIKSVKGLDLEGIETLWELACHASNSIVQERSGYLLALIHYLYMDKQHFSHWERETNSIVKDLMDILKTSSSGPTEMLNHIKVLRQFIDTFESLDFPNHFRIFYKKLYEIEDDGEEELMENSFYNFYEKKWNKQRTAIFAVTHKQTGEVKYVEVDLKDSVIKLKREVAKQFGVNAKSFEFTYSAKDNTFLQPYFDWNYVWELIKEVDPRADSTTYVNITFDAYEEKDERGRSITHSIAEEPEYLSIL